MLNRKIIVICLVICFIFSCQAVFASGELNKTNDISLANKDISAYSSANSTNQLGVENAESFSNLQDKLNNGGYVNLENNYSFNDVDDTGLKNGIVISKSVDVNGNGNVIIDAQNKARIFNIADGVSVTLRGITFINANSFGNDGGAIYSNGILNIENCKFINNTATNGGAIYIAATVGSLTNLEFTGNRAIEDGGAIYFHHDSVTGEGSGLYKSNFTNNVAGDDGGALFLYGVSGRLYDVNFNNNIAHKDGGAIMINGTDWKIYDSTFNNNNATTRRGGAIYLEESQSSDVVRCEFNNNFAGTNGGAIDWHDGASNGNVINSTFNGNIANRSAGAIYWYGYNGTIYGSEFTNNKALGNAGALNPEGVLTYGGDGGAVLFTGDLGELDKCMFINNSAVKRGGSIYLQGTGGGSCKDASFRNCVFIGNVAGTNGGAIDWNKGAQNGVVYNCTFSC